MSGRYADLRKIPREPARRLLARSNARLGTPITAPAAAPVDVVLGELEGAGAQVDMLRLLSVALPARECIWWGCLAAEDLLHGAEVPRPLAAAHPARSALTGRTSIGPGRNPGPDSCFQGDCRLKLIACECGANELQGIF